MWRRSDNPSKSNSPPVSYTHLDVYKRQLCTECATLHDRACTHTPCIFALHLTVLCLRTEPKYMDANCLCQRADTQMFVTYILCTQTQFIQNCRIFLIIDVGRHLQTTPCPSIHCKSFTATAILHTRSFCCTTHHFVRLFHRRSLLSQNLPRLWRSGATQSSILWGQRSSGTRYTWMYIRCLLYTSRCV